MAGPPEPVPPGEASGGGPVVVEQLAKSHDRKGFQSGVSALDLYLERQAGQDGRRNVSRTYVLIRQGEGTTDIPVLGFYSIAAGSVTFENIPEQVRSRLPGYPVPVVHLGRLAVDERMRGQGFGELLIADALSRALVIADGLGVFAVEVRAKEERAKAFYLKYGFEPLLDDPLRLYIPIATVRQTFGTGTAR